MPMASFSLLRYRIPTTVNHHLLRRITTAISHLPVIVTKQQEQQQNVSRKSQPPSRKMLKAKQTLAKEYTTLSPILSPDTAQNLSDSQAIGTVAAAQANFMRVIVQTLPPSTTFQKNDDQEDGDSKSKIGVELLCVVRAVLKKIKRRVLVGDRVVVGSIDWVDRRGMIENVFQRNTEIMDPPVANVDHLLVLFSMEQPKIEPFLLTRFLIEAESTRIPLTLALNKAELVDDETLTSWKLKLHSWGYEPVFCSVQSKQGLDTLAFMLRDQTTVIVGPSGVGKSSLINVLRNNPRACDASENENLFDHILDSNWFEDQRVGEVSTRSGRGKHTTRNVSLLPLSGSGYLADTPGFNQPSLLKVTKQSLAETFPEVRRILSACAPAKCAFNDCLHLGEPGCVVKSDWERYPFYFQLLDEIRIREEFQLRTYGTKKESDVRYKAGDMGVQQAEPRLEPKKHRRQSRKSINQSLLDEWDELDDDDNLLDEENDPVLRALKDENQ
ncbi:small ribosomal subunit biogenesis GTPase RsgA 1, mitochondrial [Mercurialis annua]|uniref:small ribosomal subunit biogenesis GTPase RsgA 1, mitochondrial n=1 Tax=Mercurialis annua TaxID=3986 RepID=UPI0021609431|nr:small ribosomal subunit biogenesis GTPase RsgA 1, mitochondrial [Mercurialis annua]